MESTQDKNKLIGIKGWLIFPAIWLVLTFLFSSSYISHILLRFSFLGLFTFDYANVGKTFLFRAIIEFISFLSYLFNIGIIWLFFRRNRLLPGSLIVYLWLNFSFLLIALIERDIIVYIEISFIMALIGISFITALIGTLYFIKSQRVKNTFTNKITRPDIIFIFAVIFVLILFLSFVGLRRHMGRNESVSENDLALVYKYPLLELKWAGDDETKLKQVIDGHPPAMVLDTYLEKAEFFAYQSSYGGSVVAIQLDRKGAEEFAELTKENIGKRLAIVFNGKILCAPVIRERIPDGRMEIIGDFTADEGKEIVKALNFVVMKRPR